LVAAFRAALVICGGFGNMIDRLADAAIMFGCLLLLIRSRANR
jgi:lipoprotein signal peptidase